MPSKQMNVLLNEIAAHPFLFDFDRGGLGHWLAETAADAILAQMDSELDWDGSPWPPLSEGYAAWKSEHYPGKLMAELDMIMKTPEQMIGTISITGVAMHQLYGTTEEAQQHSVWFQEGDQAGRQPPRPFYALNPQAIADLDDVLDHWFVDHLP